MTTIIDVRDVTRTFGSGPTATAALRGVSLAVGEGQLVALRGRSGSGKTTLLNIIGGLDTPDSGTVRVGGTDVTAMGEGDRVRLRRETVAYIFQSFGLLPVLSAAENVGVPLRISGVAPKVREERVALMLTLVGLADHARHRPGELSGGQQQRVAIAVAMANNPAVLLADEPTGELDSETGATVFEAFRTVNRDLGATVVIVTHDPMVAGEVRRTVAVRDGRTSSEVLRRTVTDEYGEESVSEREYVMLDRTGRVQLPAKFLEALGMEHRVAVDLGPDHIELRPDDLA